MNCRRRYAWILLGLFALGGVVAGQLGCTNALVGALYLFKGNSVGPEYKALKGKRLAIVCRPIVELQYSTGSVSEELAQTLGVFLEKNLGRIEIIDPQKVAAWTDEHEWEEFTEIGEALDAEMVLGIDLQHFSIYQGQTLYQGKALASLRLFDMREKGKVVFQKTLPQVVYPPNTGVPTSEKDEGEFRRTFVSVLADQIGRYFYAHDAYSDFARDAGSL